MSLQAACKILQDKTNKEIQAFRITKKKLIEVRFSKIKIEIRSKTQHEILRNNENKPQRFSNSNQYH